MNAGIHCSHCGAPLLEMPSRGTDCPHCGQPILEKTIPSHSACRVLTAAQAEAACQAHHSHPQNLRTLGAVDLATRELEREKLTGVAPGDDALARQQQVARIAQRLADPTERKTAALQAAWGAALAGEDYLPYLCLLHWARLEEIAAHAEYSGVRHVRLVASGPGGHSCAACERMDGQVMGIESESENPTLPVQRCTCSASGPEQTGFCLCYYEPVFDDEL